MPRPRLDAVVLAALPLRKPGTTRRGLERKLGMSKTSVFRVIERLHAAGQCHIGGWAVPPHGGRYVPRYVAGTGKDVECTLVPLPPAETQRRFREKARATGAWAERAERLKKYYRIKKANRDPETRWFAALLV